jgi:hypothetical protein
VTAQYPISAHELVVFVVPAHVAPHAVPAIDLVVDRATSGPAGNNTSFAWIVADSAVRAAREAAPYMCGSDLVPYCGTPQPVTPPVDHAAALDVALELAQAFTATHVDGLPVAVDLLAAVDTGSHVAGGPPPVFNTDHRICAGLAVHGDLTAVNVAGYVYTRWLPEWTQLGRIWLILRHRLHAMRRPESWLG